MTAQLSPTPVQKFFDNNGIPLFNGKLFSYASGTSIPQATYTDSTMGTPNTNPIIMNSRGEANIWLDPTLTYKFILKDSSGNQIWSIDNIPGNSNQGTVQTVAALRNLTGIGITNFQSVIVDGYYSPGDGGGGIFYWNASSTAADNGGTIIVPTGIATGRWFRIISDRVVTAWFGTYGDDTHDDTTALQNAINFAQTYIVPLYGRTGDIYKISTALMASSNFRFEGNGCSIDQSGIISGNKWGLAIQGTLGATTQNLTANGVVGTYTVNISNTSGFAVNDYIIVGANGVTANSYYQGQGVLAGYNVNRAEVKQILSIVLNTSITFTTPLLDTYNTADIGFIREVNWINDISINNVVFLGADSVSNQRGLSLQYVKDFIVSNCKFVHQDIYQLEVTACIKGSIYSNNFWGIYYDGVTGIDFYACPILNSSQWINFYGNVCNRNRHMCVLSAYSTGQGFYGEPRFINIECNNSFNSEANASGGGESFAFQLHGFGEYINFIGNTADGCYTGIQCENGNHVNIIGNVIRNYGSAGILLGSNGVLFKDIVIQGNNISNYTGDFTSGSPAAIRLETATNTNQFRNILIKDNVCSSCFNTTTTVGQGVVIQSTQFLQPTGNTTSTSAAITNMSSTANLAVGMAITGTGIPLGSTIIHIDSSTQITISQAATATNTGVTLTITPYMFINVVLDGNTFESTTTTVENVYAISLNNGCDNIDLFDNTIINYQSGINMSTANNCRIDGNKIMIPAWSSTTQFPATGFAIYVNGWRNVVQNNFIRGINTAVRVDINGYKNTVVNNLFSQVSSGISDAGTSTGTTSQNNSVTV